VRRFAPWSPTIAIRPLSWLYDGDRSIVDGLWKALAVDLGLAGLLCRRAWRRRATACEAAVVLEELGRFVAPAPFLTSSVVATTVLLDSDDDLLSGLTVGEGTAALAVPLSTPPGDEITGVQVQDGRLTGAVTSVAAALWADVLLVPATALSAPSTRSR
jgi:hypothetical protein